MGKIICTRALTLFSAFQCKLLGAVGCFIGMAPALWRYIDQRFKATQQAYWFVIMLEAMKTNPPACAPRSDGFTHAGGIVYRRKSQTVEHLLVEVSSDWSQWVLPKGHLEPGENPRATAIREVREETGHWAWVVRWRNKDGPLGHELNAPMVRWFLLELAEEAATWPEENRRCVWLPLAEAKQKATFPETKTLLEGAAAVINHSAKMVQPQF